MIVAQVGALAGGIEAARISGVQQAAQSASNTASQRQSSEVAEETGLRQTEVVEETKSADAASSTSNRRLDITV